MFLLWPFTKFAKMVLLGWTKWASELKIIIKKTNDLSLAIGPILKCFHRNVTLISHLPKLLKWFRSAEQNGHQS